MEESNQSGGYFNLPNPGLRAYFSHVVEGQPEDYRPPFWHGKDRATVLGEWQDVLYGHTKMQAYPTLIAFEKDMASKVGPLSIMKPLSERLDDVESYYSSIAKGGEPISPLAIAAMQEQFASARGVRLRSVENTLLNMKLSTNSGSPYFSKRRAVVKKTVPFSINGEFQFLAGKQFKYCAVLGWRGQEGGPESDDVKQRVVWMFPFAVNIAELQCYQPLIAAMQKLNLVAAKVSMNAVDEKITKLFATKGDDYVVCTDFTKFDQHFNKYLQDAAYKGIEYLLSDEASSRTWLNEIFPIKFNIPLALTMEKMRFGDHGMGSGSGGTNDDEIFGHTALQHEAAIEQGARRNPFSEAYGDDGILSYRGIKTEDVVRTYTRHGLEMNESKQYVSTDDCVYLRRWHSVSYRNASGIMIGVYPTTRALGRLLGQERFYDPEIWNSKMVTLRALSILENCCHHPLFEEFVDFVMKGDQYKLGLEIPGFYESLTTEVHKAIEIIPDFLGFTKSSQMKESQIATSINDWRVVRYVRSKGGKR